MDSSDLAKRRRLYVAATSTTSKFLLGDKFTREQKKTAEKKDLMFSSNENRSSSVNRKFHSSLSPMPKLESKFKHPDIKIKQESGSPKMVVVDANPPKSTDVNVEQHPRKLFAPKHRFDFFNKNGNAENPDIKIKQESGSPKRMMFAKENQIQKTNLNVEKSQNRMFSSKHRFVLLKKNRNAKYPDMRIKREISSDKTMMVNQTESADLKCNNSPIKVLNNKIRILKENGSSLSPMAELGSEFKHADIKIKQESGSPKMVVVDANPPKSTDVDVELHPRKLFAPKHRFDFFNKNGNTENPDIKIKQESGSPKMVVVDCKPPKQTDVNVEKCQRKLFSPKRRFTHWKKHRNAKYPDNGTQQKTNVNMKKRKEKLFTAKHRFAHWKKHRNAKYPDNGTQQKTNVNMKKRKEKLFTAKHRFAHWKEHRNSNYADIRITREVFSPKRLMVTNQPEPTDLNLEKRPTQCPSFRSSVRPNIAEEDRTALKTKLDLFTSIFYKSLVICIGQDDDKLDLICAIMEQSKLKCLDIIEPIPKGGK